MYCHFYHFISSFQKLKQYILAHFTCTIVSLLLFIDCDLYLGRADLAQMLDFSDRKIELRRDIFCTKSTAFANGLNFNSVSCP